MRDGSAPVGVNHMAVRKLSRSFLPRVTTREGTRIENGLLPWLTDSNMSGSCQFMVLSINHATPYHGIVPSAIAITHWTSRKEVVTGSKTRALELHSVEVFGTAAKF